jgi:hypothetical protein
VAERLAAALLESGQDVRDERIEADHPADPRSAAVGQTRRRAPGADAEIFAQSAEIEGFLATTEQPERDN